MTTESRRTLSESQKRALILTISVLVAFGIGAGWQYVRAHGFWEEATELRQDLTFQRLEATLATAAVEAQRGNHELALRLASDFFTGMQDHIGDAPEAAVPAFQDILALRDGAIATLSRVDERSGEMLATMLSRYRAALGEPVGPDPASVAPTPDDTVPPGDA
jgi:hypothetical protein